MQQWHTQKVDALLCYAVAAMGARCINHDNNDEPHDQMYFDQCQWLLEQGVARDHASQLSSVQALVLLCWYAHLRGQMQACASMRHRLGQACDKLGLDRDPEPSVGLVCMEMHRRAYWMVFITDQWLGWSLTQCGLASGAANGIAAANVAWPQLEDQQLYLIDRPARDHATPIVDQNVDHNHAARDLSTTTAEHALQINTFAQLIKLSTLVREITQLARHRPYDTRDPLPWHAYQQQHNALEKQLTEWLLQLPSYLEFGKPADDRPVSPMATVYHMLYYAVQLMLYEPLTANTHDDAVAPAIESTRTKARNICTNASNTILHLAEQMLQNGQKAYFGNIFMITLSLASSVYLHERVHHGPQRIAFDGTNDASIAPQERADLYAHAVLKAVALISHYLPAAVDLPQRVHSYFSIHTPSMDGNGAASAPTSPSTRSTSNNRSKKRRYSDCSSSVVSENASIHGSVVPRPFAMPDDLCSGDDDLLDVGLDALLSETTPLSSPSTSCHSNDASFSSLTMAWMEDTDLWAFMNSQPSPVTPHPGPSSHVTPYPTLSSPSSASSTSMAFVSHFDQPIQQPLTPPDAHHALLVPPVPPCTTMDAMYHIQSPVWKSQDNATDLIDPYTYMPVIHC
ncbi:hypothetical protein BC940DRAFT_137714 [Gongronella butleri]|nr:hypothetical protein BC940DRAFT_137714 [Gongronella butleri]